MSRANCVCCGAPLPESHKHNTCSMCYGDLDYGTDGYYREYIEQWQREHQAAQEGENE